MTPHIEAANGEIAETILLPGDPARAKWIAETYLEDAICYNQVRGMLGFTGRYKGTEISVQGTGMGQPSLAIYVHELMHHYGVKTLMRVGSCGGIAPDLNVNDVILAMAASTDSSMNQRQFAGMDFAPCADWQLLHTAAQCAGKRDVPVRIGGVFSGDRFYSGDDDYLRQMRAHGVLAVDMETNTLYTQAARNNARALTLLTVSDMIGGGEELSPLERQTSLTKMVEIALDVAVAA